MYFIGLESDCQVKIFFMDRCSAKTLEAVSYTHLDVYKRQWEIIVNINGALQAVGYALLVLFFLIGVVKTCGSFVEIKRPEVALKMFVRFVLAKAAITYGLELMMALFRIVQGVISTVMDTAGVGGAMQAVTLPPEMDAAVRDLPFLDSIPVWLVSLIGGLIITVLSFIMIMSVYGRFFKLYMYTAIAPIPLAGFAGEPTAVSYTHLDVYKRQDRRRYDGAGILRSKTVRRVSGNAGAARKNIGRQYPPCDGAKSQSYIYPDRGGMGGTGTRNTKRTRAQRHQAIQAG